MRSPWLTVLRGMALTALVLIVDGISFAVAAASVANSADAACDHMATATPLGTVLVLGWAVAATAPLAWLARRERAASLWVLWGVAQAATLALAAHTIAQPPPFICF